MRHLVIGQRQKAPNFSAFHWSPHGCLITIGQHFVTTRVVHLPKSTETSLITESDQSGPSHQLLQLCTASIAWSDSDQAVLALHSCNSWLSYSKQTNNLVLLLPNIDIISIATTMERRYFNNYFKNSLNTYSRTSVARTLMARLSRLFRTRS